MRLTIAVWLHLVGIAMLAIRTSADPSWSTTWSPSELVVLTSAWLLVVTFTLQRCRLPLSLVMWASWATGVVAGAGALGDQQLTGMLAPTSALLLIAAGLLSVEQRQLRSAPLRLPSDAREA
ncbi:MAG: hypothetical protein JWO02_4384 [Solirubrobacterales bacterium]|nr:hypothetical protein [Solirubrobacterales bacterium]